MMLFSCENDLKTVKEFVPIDSIQGLVAYNIDFIRSDSGRVTTELKAPLMNNIEGENGRLEFKKGFFATMFNAGVATSTITAKYGVNYINTDLVFARDSVVVTNLETQETLYTEQLFWYRDTHKIRTGTAVTIISPDKEILGDSLVATDGFTTYTLYGIHARIDF